MALPYTRRARAPKNPPTSRRWTLIVPPVTLFVLMVISTMPSNMTLHLYAAPFLAIMGIYFWSIHRPDAMPLLLLFALGILNDLLVGEPLLGSSAFLFVGVGWGIASQTSFFRAQNFITLWFGFIVIAAALILIQNILSYLFLSTSLPFDADIMALLVNALLYPVVASVLSLIWFGLAKLSNPNLGFGPANSI